MPAWIIEASIFRTSSHCHLPCANVLTITPTAHTATEKGKEGYRKGEGGRYEKERKRE